MKRFVVLLICTILCLMFASCSAGDNQTTEGAPQKAAMNSFAPVQSASSDENQPKQAATAEISADKDKRMNNKLKVSFNGESFIINLEDNAAAREFADMIKDGVFEIKFSDYGGFEKVGSLGRQLTADNVNMTTEPGDVVLYNGSNIVMFYRSNTWDYTKLATAEDARGFADALKATDDITALFEAAE